MSTKACCFQFLGEDHAARFSVDGVLLVTLGFEDPGVDCSSSNFKVATLAPVTGDYVLPGSGETTWIERLYSYLDYDIALYDVSLLIDASAGSTPTPHGVQTIDHRETAA